MAADTDIAPNAVDGRTLGLWFSDLPTRITTRKVVLHWTGGESPAARVYRTLVNRGLSIHFVVERDGRIVQMAPLVARAAHAGSLVNADSVGIEIVNAGTVLSTAHPSRPVKVGRIHGRAVRYADFLPAQYEAVERLVIWLLARFSLPEIVATPTTIFPSTETLRSFRGVVGHYQISTNKLDPGPALLDHLRRVLSGGGVSLLPFIDSPLVGGSGEAPASFAWLLGGVLVGVIGVVSVWLLSRRRAS